MTPDHPSPVPQECTPPLTNLAEPSSPISMDTLDSWMDNLNYSYGFCRYDAGPTIFPFSTSALQCTSATFIKLQRAYLALGESLPTTYHTPLINFTNILIMNCRVELEHLKQANCQEELMQKD